MVAEILEVLAPKPGEMGVDCTLGYGGHARGGRPAAEQFRGHEVHAAIGALGREDGGQKELEWRAEIERTARGGVKL